MPADDTEHAVIGQLGQRSSVPRRQSLRAQLPRHAVISHFGRRLTQGHRYESNMQCLCQTTSVRKCIKMSQVLKRNLAREGSCATVMRHRCPIALNCQGKAQLSPQRSASILEAPSPGILPDSGLTASAASVMRSGAFLVLRPVASRCPLQV